MGSTVTISQERLDELVAAESKLWALEAQGVDNWCGYDDAMERLRSEDDDD